MASSSVRRDGKPPRRSILGLLKRGAVPAPAAKRLSAVKQQPPSAARLAWLAVRQGSRRRTWGVQMPYRPSAPTPRMTAAEMRRRKDSTRAKRARADRIEKLGSQ